MSSVITGQIISLSMVYLDLILARTRGEGIENNNNDKDKHSDDNVIHVSLNLSSKPGCVSPL